MLGSIELLAVMLTFCVTAICTAAYAMCWMAFSPLSRREQLFIWVLTVVVVGEFFQFEAYLGQWWLLYLITSVLQISVAVTLLAIGHRLAVDFTTAASRGTSAEAALVAAVTHSPVGYITTDERGRILSANAAATTLTGEIIDKDIGNVLSVRDGVFCQYAVVVSGLQEATQFNTYITSVTPFIPVHVTVSIIPASPKRLLFHVMDLTAVTSKQQEVQRRVADLQQFAAVAAHDLQEPLRKIEMFADQLCPRADMQQRDCQGHIRQTAQRMRTLVTELLTYTEAQQTVSKCQDVYLNEVVGQAHADTLASIVRTGTIIVCKPLPRGHWDFVRLTQVFQNLISNAIKYNKNQPVILISWEPVRDGYVISVADNGIGIPQQYLATVFQPFKRLHPRTEYEGTGMGLAIVDMIVTSHGGRVWAENNPGGGTIIKIKLPRSGVCCDKTG